MDEIIASKTVHLRITYNTHIQIHTVIIIALYAHYAYTYIHTHIV